MKKLTLNQAWRLCLKQWKWMIPNLNDDNDIEDLKDEYFDVIMAGDNDIPDNNCYFCEYNEQQGGHSGLGESGDCSHCPGVLVNKRFSCGNDTYHFATYPLKFHAKLLELDKKRKAK